MLYPAFAVLRQTCEMTFSDFLSPDSFSASVRLNTIADAVESLSATKYLFVRAERRRRFDCLRVRYDSVSRQDERNPRTAAPIGPGADVGGVSPVPVQM